MKIRFIEILLAGILLGAISSTNAWAGRFNPYYQSESGYRHVAEKEVMSLKDAAAKVREQTDGRILSAKEKVRDGSIVYRIKVLMPNGVVRTVTVNPNEN